MFYIEDYLETLANFQNNQGTIPFVIERSDYNLITSLGRQTLRGIGLTDRQYELVKQKLLHYKNQFEANGYENIQLDFENLRTPIRSIDRSRWIKIVDIEDQKYLGVRFSFNKKLISALEQISSLEDRRLFDKQNKIKYFVYNEQNVYKIITLLKDKNFVIEENLQKQYEILEMMDKNKNNYIPGIYGFKLKNMHDNAINFCISSIGEPSIDNLAHYADRNAVLGIEHFDTEDLNISINKLTGLSQKIVRRTQRHVLIDPNTYAFDRVAESILELNRYPLLVILNDKSDNNDIHTVYQSFRNIFSNDSFCALYRKDNTTEDNKQFNQYIKTNSLNNSLAFDSKIVYTNVNKMSKILLQSDWKPQCAIFMGSHRTSKLNTYLDELDLIIHYDDAPSPFYNYGSKMDKL